MTEAPRQSAFMPSIKCSNCGNQVEISMMGDHVCGSAPPAAEPPPPMPDLLGGAFSSLKHSVFDKFTRVPPAVDTNAANRAFSKSDQLTPLSASTGSQAISPKTPSGRPGAGPTEDEYFAPAIAGSPRRPGGYGGFGGRESYEPDSTYGTSPNKSNLLTRMNSIAPGPFEMNRRAGSTNAFARSNSRDNLDPSDELLRPGTATSNSSNTSGGVAPPRAPRKNGYGGFGPPQRDGEDFEPQPLGLGKRSETFPERLLKANDNERLEPPARTPSAPGTRSDRLRSSSNIGIRDTSRPPPPRTNSIAPPPDGPRKLSINLADEFGASNPYHSPSVSQSSSNSGYSHNSQPSQASSNTSPARSMGSRTGARRPSDNAGFDALMDDLQSSMDAMSPNGLPPSPGLKPPVDRNVQPLRPGNRRTPPEDLRLDPAIQNGRVPPLGSPMRSPMRSPLRSPGTPGFGNRQDPAVQEGQSQSSPPRAHKRQPSRSRGNCKACKKAITGKSISSADGRLTGRYHKTCFVCTTCQEPFSSAEFYVLNDKPYCEQHYHKLNGSLCGSCNRGIEGQYLEDEAPRKYHPGCFRCGDCGIVLRDGYFDVNGRAYCERDAWKRMQFMAQQQQQGPPQGQRGMPMGPPRGLPAGPGPLNRPFGLPTGNRLAPGQALGRGGLTPMPRMEKRRTRLGMM
ncbi:hypothetical protein F5B20DRAFT_130348 [Whalleya microplaca]|nr:hypothetical protein F5B20DRAFT_130348 [Whalleya microplaca]